MQGDPHIRFYAGAPILARHGHVLGTVCVIDNKPRIVAPEQVQALEALARQATELLEMRKLNQPQEEAAEDLKRTSLQLRLTVEAGGLGIFSWRVDQDVTVWETTVCTRSSVGKPEQGPVAAFCTDHHADRNWPCL